jgi:elongation factor P
MTTAAAAAGIVRETNMTATPAGAACMDRREMEYVYQDGDGVILLDPDTDLLLTLPHEQAGAALLYLREGGRVHVLFQEGRPFTLEPPGAVELAVTDTEPRGPAADKAALLETGLKLMVPASVEIGEVIVVDTRSGMYLGKVDRAPAAG